MKMGAGEKFLLDKSSWPGDHTSMMKRICIVLLALVTHVKAVLPPEIIQATKEGNVKALEDYVAKGKNINETDEEGNSLLVTALNTWQFGVLKFLVHNGAQVPPLNYANEDFWNQAVNDAPLSVVQTLIEPWLPLTQEQKHFILHICIDRTKDGPLKALLEAPEKTSYIKTNTGGRFFRAEEAALRDLRSSLLSQKAIKNGREKDRTIDSTIKAMTPDLIKAVKARDPRFYQPDLSEFSKEMRLQYPSASQFSGARAWAHSKGLLGRDVPILVLEDHSRVERPLMPHGTSLFPDSILPHALSVMGVVEEIAPEAHIQLQYVQSFKGTDTYRHTLVNMSFNLSGSASANIRERLKPLFQKEYDNLMIWAASNEGKPMAKVSSGVYWIELMRDPEIRERIIFAGGLDPSFRNNRLNTPGDNPDFQARYLCTLGVDVPTKTVHDGYDVLEGTSFAAPAITGAAALILSAYKHLSMPEVGAILLASAERNFFIPNEEGPGGTFVYEGTPPASRSRDPHINYSRFSAEIYGQGVLSLRRALLYGEFFAAIKQKRPGLTLEEYCSTTRPLFEEAIKRQEQKAYVVITKKWLKSRASRQARNSSLNTS